MESIGRVAEIWRYPVKSMVGESLAHGIVGPRGIHGDRGWAIRDEKAREIRGARKLPALMRCRATYLSEPSPEVVPAAEIALPDGSRFRSDAPEANAILSELVGRPVSIWPIHPASDLDFYRRGAPDNPDLKEELRDLFGRVGDEPVPELTMFPEEIWHFTSPLGTYFDAYPFNVLTTATLETLRAHTPKARIDARRFRPNLVVETRAGIDGLPEAGWKGRTIRIGATRIKLEEPTIRCVMTSLETGDLPKDPSVLRTIVREAAQCVGSNATIATAGPVAVGDEVALE